MKVQKDWEGVYQEVNEIVKVARNSKVDARNTTKENISE